MVSYAKWDDNGNDILMCRDKIYVMGQSFAFKNPLIGTNGEPTEGMMSVTWSAKGDIKIFMNGEKVKEGKITKEVMFLKY